MYTITERDMILTLATVLESENDITLANIIRISKTVYNPQWEFSGIVSDQKQLYATIKVPLDFRKMVEENLDKISSIAIKIYDDNNNYYLLGINNVGILPIRTEEVEFEDKRVFFEKDSVFSNFIKF